jgi:hypothetical protein
VRIITVLLAIFLNGCALLPGGDDDTNDPGNGQTKVRLAEPGKIDTDWWVTDRPETNKLYVSPTTARTLGLSLIGGIVLSPSVFLPTQTDYQKVAIQFLNQNGRGGCKIVSGAQASQFQYEFGYDCTANK